jgi:hypothetical protein
MVDHIPTDRNDAQDPAQADRPPAAEAKPVAPTARRRLLRTGLIGGPVALLTAGKPVKSFASSSYCSFSGWNSVNVSKKKGKSKSGGKTLSHVPAAGTCNSGHPPSYYHTTVRGVVTAQNWPTKFNSVSLKSGTSGSATKFSGIFPAGDLGGMANDYLLTILSSHSTTVEALAIAAAFSSVQVVGFPYYGKSGALVTLWNNYGVKSGNDGSLSNAQALQSYLSQFV